jgi:vacuolar-type H+-ATPase subunit H
MSPYRIYIIAAFLTIAHIAKAQVDSVLQTAQEVPAKFIQQADKKIDQYTSRITNKTEKTLTKLSRWENKIQSLLQKVNPEAAQRLFAANQLTFTKALEKYKQGAAVIADQRARYDEYKDKLTTSLGYLEKQKDQLDEKFISQVKAAKQKVDKLETEEVNTEAMQEFIKQRRKQLLDESIKYIGNSKYLQKISKENYYYIETLKNYKAIFLDKKKAEQTALTLLNKIPAFTKFARENSMLARLFGSTSLTGSTASLAGLQTRASVNALIQNQIASGGPDARAQIQQNMQAAQAELSKLKDKILKAGGGSSEEVNIPDFKPNSQKTKTFLQRIELGSNIQFVKNNSLVPTTADIGLSLGYKLNDKSVIGLGGSYKMGMGSIEHISITHQGIGLRSFMDWKLKKQFFISGGYEMNYNAQFKNINQLQQYSDWQSSGLVGLSKKIPVKSKLMKGTKAQLLYDFLARQHMPVSQPVIFRVGYNF